jgi:hypothetical protein
MKGICSNNWILFFCLSINVREYTRGKKNGHSGETGNIGHSRWRQTKWKHNAIYVGHHYTHTSTYNVNKTWALKIMKSQIVTLC